MSTDNGSARLESAENGASYNVLVTAAVKERTVNFTVTIRYRSDVSMEMSYTVMEDGAQKPCVLTCENKKTVNADPVYDDQLTGRIAHIYVRHPRRGSVGRDHPVCKVLPVRQLQNDHAPRPQRQCHAASE